MDPARTRRETALEFVRRFCAGDVAGLGDLLAEDFQLAGPLHRFDSREAYLESLRRDPPEAAPFRILSITSEVEQVVILWEYLKPGYPLIIAQLFRFGGAKIGDIVIVFDTQTRSED